MSRLAKFVKYIANPEREDYGRIVSYLQGDYDTLMANEDGWGKDCDIFEVDETPSSQQYRLDLSGEVPDIVPRPDHPGPNKTQIAADGEDAAVISGIKAGARVTVLRPGLGLAEAVSDGTDIEVVSEHPGLVVVTILGCWPWKEPVRFEIEAVAP